MLVVSPHLDDAVLSLGATIAAHTRAGGQALVVTAPAGDPDVTGLASAWDTVGGFTGVGQAVGARRREDVLACRAIGAEVRHLPGFDEQYGVPWDERSLEEALRAAWDGADDVLLPGHPLLHGDHRAVTGFALGLLDADRSVRLYAEEPYTSALRATTSADDPWRGAVGWAGRPGSAADVARKLTAVLRYWSQVKALTGARGGLDPRWLRLPVRLWWAARGRGELVTEPVPAGDLVRALRRPPAVQGAGGA